ncbi:pyridoxamine 5'-phosphate oxidase family protein [Catenovulum sediminis]|uniref:Pyridoxamine 5'-phosphate oxidase family protein n=1 Tax=Catenovulum sediminis TaxID=1740262 RepID=A0ABV1RIF1_9ALTE
MAHASNKYLSGSTKGSVFHSGEQAFHQQLNIGEKMEAVANQFIRPFMPEQHQIFFSQLPFVWLGFIDQTNAPWASVVFNTQNKLIDVHNQTQLSIQLDSTFNDSKLSKESIKDTIGLLGIEPTSRRRNRLSAQITQWAGNTIHLSVKQSFGNCPKYIQARHFGFTARTTQNHKSRVQIKQLDESHRALIKQADSFYIASFYHNNANSHVSNGADISHRGGLPGFVKVDGNTIRFPDFSGNQFFNTLGNIKQNGCAGLTFVDYQHGHLLQLTGFAKIIENDPLLKYFKGALRFIDFEMTHGEWAAHFLPFVWGNAEFSANLKNTGTWQQADQAFQLNQSESKQ